METMLAPADDVSRDEATGATAHREENASATALRWYLIHCKPRQEERALENLERQDFHCYHARRRVERLREGRRYFLTEPLFPGYIFIRLDKVNDNWYAIRSTRGVNQIVRFNEYPAPVRDELIDGIRERLEGPTAPVVPYLKPGERVRITHGAFSQLEAIFVANDGNERVVLLLNILQKDQQLIFPVSHIRKIGH